MITDPQKVCGEIRAAVDQLGEACRRIEAMDPGCTSLETFGEMVKAFQAACLLTGPCLQKLQDVTGRYEQCD